MTEIDQLRAELAGVKSALSITLAIAKVTNEFASALAFAHPNPQLVLHAFNAIADASDGPLQYSRAMDEDLQQVELAREAVRVQLKSTQQTQ